MSFAHLRKTHAHLRFFANQPLIEIDSHQLLCCDMLQFVVCVCVCVFETCLHVFLLVSDIIGASCGH